MTTAVGLVPQSTAIEFIALSHLLPHPANRKQFDPKKLDELVASIEKVGIHTPLIVRPCADPGPRAFHPAYEILAGERRWRAASKVRKVAGRVGLDTVPCIVRELTDDEALELLLTENLQREDPHPLEEADAYAAWLERPGHDVAELAARIGKSVAHVYSRLQLRNLTEGARQAVATDGLPIGHAQLLARLSPKQQDQAVNKLAAEAWKGTPTLAQFTREISHLNPHLDQARFDTADATLCPSAGACGTCPKRLGFKDGVFPELAQLLAAENADSDGDQCLDAECFEEKTAAHVAAQVAAAREQHGDAVVLVSWKFGDKWPAKASAPLPRGLWKLVKRETKGAVPAVVVKEDTMGGRSDARLGDLVWVVLAPRPSADGKAPAAAQAKADERPSPEEQRAAREAHAKQELPRRGALAKVILTKIPKAIDLPWLVDVAYRDISQYHVKESAKFLGITAPSPKSRKPADVMLTLVLAEIGDELDLHHAAWNEMQSLPAMAQRLGLNPKKILADYDALVKAAEKVAAKPQPKPATKAPKQRAGDVARAKKAKKGGKK